MPRKNIKYPKRRVIAEGFPQYLNSDHFGLEDTMWTELNSCYKTREYRIIIEEVAERK